MTINATSGQMQIIFILQGGNLKRKKITEGKQNSSTLQRVETYLPFMMTIYDNLYDGEL
jgi:hypothetical protein